LFTVLYTARQDVELLLSFQQKHCSFSQYLGQFRRCSDAACCPPQNKLITEHLMPHKGWFPTAVRTSAPKETYETLQGEYLWSYFKGLLFL